MRRYLLLHLAGLTLAACATLQPLPQGPAQRHAALVGTADQAIGRMVDHLALRERTEIDQSASLRYAAGGAVPSAAPVSGSVNARSAPALVPMTTSLSEVRT